MRVVRDDLWLCTDCLFAAVNGDFTGLDYHYDPEAAKRRHDEIVARLDALGPNLAPAYDSETEEGILSFSRTPCGCCGTNLGGARHAFEALGEEADHAT